MPRFSVYLQHRNAVRFVRKHFPMTLPFCAVAMVLYAVRYFIRGSVAELHCRAPRATFAGLRDETGPPICYPEFCKLIEG